MEKQLNKKNILKKLTAVLTALSLSVSVFSVFAAGPENDAVKENENTNESSEDMLYSPYMEYSKYLSEHSDSKYPDSGAMVRGAKYSKAENGVFKKENISDDDGILKENVLVWESAGGKVTYEVYIPEDGLYNICMSFCPLNADINSTEVSLSIDGEIPFDAASRIILPRTWVNKNEITENSRGNQMRPSQIQKRMWTVSDLKDTDGLHNESLFFCLTKGRHTVTFESEKACIAVEYLKFYNHVSLKSYNDIRPSDEEIEKTPSTLVRIEGEDAVYKSDPTLYPTSDNSSYLASPNTPGKMIYNTIGDGTWKKANQSISWEIPADSISGDGWYKIGIKSRQKEMRGFYSNRRIYLDGKIACSELDRVKFFYDDDWNIVTPETTDGESVYVYLEAGKDHLLTMEAVPGEIGEYMIGLSDLVVQINEYYRKILMITGPSPDKYTDYNVDKAIPELTGDLEKISAELKNIKSGIEKLSGMTGSEAAGIERMYVILDKCVEGPQNIPQYLTQLKDNSSAIASWMRDYRDQPLEVDYIEIASPDRDFSDVKEKPLKSFVFGFKAFMASFFEDYNLVSEETSDDVLEVWVNLGRDQALAVKELTESEFTPQTGIPVNLKLVQGGVIEAELAGKGPDAVLFLGGEFPVNLACRGLAVDLLNFCDEEGLKKNYEKSAFDMYRYNGGIYALPLEQNFPVMFYRKDILSGLGFSGPPETWDDLIDMIPALQRNYMSAGLVLPSSGGSPSTESGHTFALLMLQNGLNYYKNDFSSTNFDRIEAVSSFEKWTDFYTKYKFEQVYDSFSRFRDGTYPIVIQSYTFYNQLKAAAPEINGTWDFTSVPGTKQSDGTVSHAANWQGNGAMIFESCENKEDAWEYISWFASSDIQKKYAASVEGLLGILGRYDPADKEALESLSWTSDELSKLEAQREELEGIPVIPASYAVTRNIMSAFRKTANEHENPRDTIMWYNRDINEEIDRKRKNLEEK